MMNGHIFTMEILDVSLHCDRKELQTNININVPQKVS